MAQALKIWEIIPTLGGGGAEKMVLDLADGIQDAGFDVTVISLYDKKHAADNRVKFAQEHELRISYLDKKPGFDVRLLQKLAGMIREQKPDIIHTHIESFQYLAVAGKFTKFKHVHTMHSTAGREPRIYRQLLKSESNNHRTHFVVLSDQIGRSMKKYFGTDEARLTCIPNGIDRDRFVPQKRAYDDGPVNFIAVGSLSPVKNQAMLIDAFAKLQNERRYRDNLTILGEGVLRAELEGQVKRLGLEDRVSLPGNVDDVPTYLGKADVYVMTSHFEGVSLALLEAASTGLPVIVSRTGNTPVVVLDDAILIEDNDETALRREMKRMADDLKHRKIYGERALKLADRFDKDKMVASYIDLYKSIV